MLQGTCEVSIGLVYPSAVPPSLLGSLCHLAFRGLLFPPSWATFCIFYITRRTWDSLVCVVDVFWWITSINVLNQFCRASYLSWVWMLHKPGRVWKGKQKALSPCLSMWTPVHGAGNMTIFTPVEWRVKLSWVLECVLTVDSQGRSQNLKPGAKECTSDDGPDVPKLNGSKELYLLDPWSYFQNTMDVDFISSHNMWSECCFDGNWLFLF